MSPAYTRSKAKAKASTQAIAKAYTKAKAKAKASGTRKHRQVTSSRLPKPTKSFTYKPLPSLSSIRIFKLLRGKPESRVRCLVSTVEREYAQTLHYQAISYAWGKPEDKENISCNGKDLKVPINLIHALERLRDLDVPKYFWADSVCINQDDQYDERRHQVRQMGEIYSNADKVVIFLSTENPFEYHFGEGEEETLPVLVEPFFAPLDDARTRGDDPFTALNLGDGYVHLFWTTFSKVNDLPWFSRMWVVQEAGLGKSVRVLLGKMEFDFDDWLTIIKRLTEYPNVAEYFNIRVNDIYTLYPARSYNISEVRQPNKGGKKHRPEDFLSLLQRTRNLKASNPRDHIYAMLGHSSALVGGKPIVEADYTKSLLDLLIEVAIKIMKQSQSLNFMSAVCHLRDEDIEGKSPSWVPFQDFSAPESVACKPLGLGFMPENQHGLASFVGAALPSSWTLLSPANILEVEGFVFDSIQEQTETIKTASTTRIAGKMAIEKWPLQHALSFKACKKMSEDQRITELSVNCTGGYQPTEQCKKDFVAFVIVELTRDPDENRGLNILLSQGQEERDEIVEREFALRWQHMAEEVLDGRKVFATQRGMLGIGPAVLRNGDICCFLSGNTLPMILRKFGRSYKLVGEAYIHGVMDWHIDMTQSLRRKTFRII